MNPPSYDAATGEKGQHSAAPYPPATTAGMYPPTGAGFSAGPPSQPPPPIGFQYPSNPQAPFMPQPEYLPQGVVITQQPLITVPSGTTTVVHVTRVPHLPLPPASSRYECPSCKGDIRTRVEYKTGTKTHLIAALLCLFGCWCCVPIPYCCSNDCKDAHHYCPHCDAYIGISARN
ncbi:lipopolysaccharide-induced tumor necrosis factor-alpha factor homolog [Cloeon dipterum]|uniref:lipopolysaccharide-induced tumor necrosis factor-alpha factor homolog n=1 Tax=Cloeon dipterum TaxID=197152 RepID=UPI0032204BD4